MTLLPRILSILLIPEILMAGITGNITYHHQIAGEGVKPRDLMVWLPPGYSTEPGRRYPVLYMHDGQNVFDPSTSYAGEWGADETADRLIREGKIEPIIIVGIYNTPDRMPEYGGEAEPTDKYMRFVVNVVKPLVDSTYRTKPGREDTATMGSSMGGLISFLLVWEHPSTFSKAGCLSPAFVRAMDRIKAKVPSPQPMRFYLDNGGVGMDKDRLQSGCDDALAYLHAAGFNDPADLTWYLDETGEHNEPSWAARLWRPLEFLYGVVAAP